MTKKYCLLIICIIALAIMFLIARGLTKEVPAHMLDIQCEKTLKNEIVVNCSAIASSDIYAKHEIVIENNEAYIKVFYYAIPFFEEYREW